MSRNQSPTIEKALTSLGIEQWRLMGNDPSNEAEFNLRFEKSGGHVILNIIRLKETKIKMEKRQFIK